MPRRSCRPALDVALEPKTDVLDRFRIRPPPTSVLGGRKRSVTQCFSSPGNERQKKSLVGGIAVQPCLFRLRFRHAEEIRGTFPLLEQSRKAGGNFEHALSRRTEADLLGDGQGVKQGRVHAVAVAATDGNHGQVEQADRYVLAIAQRARKCQKLRIKRLCRVEVSLRAIDLCQPVESRRKLPPAS